MYFLKQVPFFALFFFAHNLFSQQIYFARDSATTSFGFQKQIGLLDVNDCTHETILNDAVFTGNIFKGITILPNSQILVVNQGDLDTIYYIYEADIVNQELINLEIIPPGVRMIANPSGILYFLNSSYIQMFDLQTLEIDSIGPIGIDGIPVHEVRNMTFFNGKLHATVALATDGIPNNIVSVNVDNPLQSNLVFELDETFPTNTFILDIVTLNYGCFDADTYLILWEVFALTPYLYKLNLLTGELTEICELAEEFVFTRGLTSPLQLNTFDNCSPLIDLDENDSSAFGFDYHADTICLTNPYLFLQNADILINALSTLDSVWIGLTGGNVDGTAESLGCVEFPGFSCNLFNNGLTLSNVDSLTEAEIAFWLSEVVFYENTASNPTSGVRTIAVVAFDACYPSDTAFVELPIGVVPMPDTSLINLCQGEIFPYQGVTFTNDTLLCDQQLTSFGCDSIICFDIQFEGFVETQLQAEICEGDSYSFNDMLLTTAGFYQDTIMIFNNCDTIYQLDLTILEVDEGTISGDTTFCEGTIGSLQVNPDFSQYAWSTNENTPEIEITNAGNYMVTLTDFQGCTQVLTQNTVFGSDLSATINSILPNCQNTTGSINITNISGGSGDYLVSLNNGIFSVTTFFENLSSGNYSIIIEDSEGCQLQENVTLTTLTDLFLNLGDDQTITLGDSVLINLQTNASEIASLTVFPNVLISYQNETTIWLTTFESGNFLFEITDSSGCTASATLFIEIETGELIYTPNIFSPNNDGINDVFQIFVSPTVTDILSTKIFNRWGGLVYDSVGNNFWDGRFKEKRAETGVYTFLIEVLLFDGTRSQFSGDLLLIR